MKILLTDIETLPNLIYTWDLWSTTISIEKMVEPGRTACWSAKWFGDKDMAFSSLHEADEETMLRRIYDLLEEADVVVHYNGKKFDIPTLNREFIRFGWTPPKPYRQIDLYQTVKKNFKFASNKLDFVCQQLKIGSKIQHKGFELWKGCMADDIESWETMKEYNINDVVLLEKLYVKLLPWITNPPNHNLFSDISCCPYCGSFHFNKRGFTNTIRKRQRYKCMDCGGWFQDRLGVKDKPVLFKGETNG